MADEIIKKDAMSASAAIDDLDNKTLTFNIADVVYGVELKNVNEIISIQYITHVPNLPYYIKGITNLRGKIVPVIDTRAKLGVEEHEYDSKTCIVVLNINGMQIGLIVDRVREVISIESAKLTSIPEIGDLKNKKYLSSVTKMSDHMILNLDIEYLINDDGM